MHLKKYRIRQHKPSDLGGRRAEVLFDFREPYDDDMNTALYGDWPDTRVRGLIFHIGKQKAVWRFKQHVQLNGHRKTYFQTLGFHPEMDITAARKAATIFAATVASGKARPGRRAARRFGEAWRAYLVHLEAQAEKRGKPARWAINAKKLADAHILPHWEHWALVDMSDDPRAVANWYAKLAKKMPTSAAHCVRLIRATYNAEKRFDRSLPAELPTSGVKLGKIVTTERAMAFDQFPAWAKAWHQIESPTLRGFHLCGLLTGARPGELAMVRRDDFDPVAQRLTIRNSKSGRDIVIPTTVEIEYAIGLALDAPVPTIVQKGLRGMKRNEVRVVERLRHGEVRFPDLIFPGCRQAPARSTLPAAGHALRHTYKTTAAALGISDTLSAILLGHALPGISGRYIGELAISRSAELRAAQELISRRVFELVDLKLPAPRLRAVS
jgi:integrase